MITDPLSAFVAGDVFGTIVVFIILWVMKKYSPTPLNQYTVLGAPAERVKANGQPLTPAEQEFMDRAVIDRELEAEYYRQTVLEEYGPEFLSNRYDTEDDDNAKLETHKR
jgi:hypothetical protein